MRRGDEEQILLRIFIGEGDRWHRQPLYEALVEMFRREGFAGASVFRGVMGFGARSITHTDKILRLSADLPVVVEVVERLEKIEMILPRLDGMLAGGLMTMEKVRVITYAGEKNGADRWPKGSGVGEET
ncbi:MAG: DUF190 domain-containing protein [Desulfuromonadales bacterium]|nr:DUF190 domain-containing protein [Desulfuromonadales bacterium]